MSMKAARTVILLISTMLFCYQLYTAVILLLRPPTIDFKSEIDITWYLPLITICATDLVERHKEAFMHHEYESSRRLIQGDYMEERVKRAI